jgi:hypothetical protein
MGQNPAGQRWPNLFKRATTVFMWWFARDILLKIVIIGIRGLQNYRARNFYSVCVCVCVCVYIYIYIYIHIYAL